MLKAVCRKKDCNKLAYLRHDGYCSKECQEKRMKIEIIKCCSCSVLEISVNDIRHGHKCAGQWNIVKVFEVDEFIINDLIANLKNCISANYGSAMVIKKKLLDGKTITANDFDLNMIIDRSYLHLEKK